MATKKIKPVQKKAQVHVMIEYPVQTRRAILNCALDTTKLLKESHEIVSLRERKFKTLKRLQKVMYEVRLLEKQLSVHMPEFNETVSAGVEHLHHMKQEHHAIHVPKPANEEKPKVEVKRAISKAPKSEADKLKDELREIEEKLKSL